MTLRQPSIEQKLPGTLAQSSPASWPVSVCRVAERKYHSSGIAKTALIVSSAEWVGKSRQQVVNLGRPERDTLVDRNVKPAAKLHRERIRGRCSGYAYAPTGCWLTQCLKGIAVDVRVRPTKQQLSKRM